MKLNRTRVLAIAVGLAVVVAAAVAPIALGSPSSGATTTVLGHRATLPDSVHFNVDQIKFQTKDPTDFQTQTITFQPGGSSGWHHHPGIIWVIVESGQVTTHDENCQTKTYGPHQVFIESGSAPFMVSNDSTTTNAVVYATQAAPAGGPFRVEDNPPPCA